ncbi:MAG: GT4 family glycosyltransferase PelF [Candidatus Omnitrophota bacterium]
MIKVLIIIDNLNKGGAQQQLLKFIAGYDRSRFDITVCALDATENYMLSEFEKAGARVIIIPQRGKFCLPTLAALYQLIQREKFAIIHTYLATADYYGRLAAILAGRAKIISSVRGEDRWKKKQHIWADRILHRFTDRIVVNAGRLRGIIEKRDWAPSDKIVKIYNGIDLTQTPRHQDTKTPVKPSLGIMDGELVVGAVGRLGPEKDYPTFLKAAARITKEIPNVKFIIVGDGPLSQELRLRAMSYDLSAKIIFTGLRDDTLDIMRTFDALVLTSLYEGCPNVVMEAMALGRPVVATDVGGCAELISDGETGYIAKVGDHRDIAAKVITLLKDKTLRERMGEAGRKRIATYFSVQLMVEKIENLYANLTKIAFIMPQFPRYDETFILREVLELKRQGLNLLVFSLRTPKDKIVHQAADEFLDRVINLPFILSLEILFSIFYFLISKPLRFLNSLIFLLTRYAKSPRALLKALAVFPKTIAFARICQKQNVQLVHGYWATTPTVCAMIIQRLTGIPFSFTGHAHDIHLDTVGLREKIERAQFVITCTRDNKRYLEELLMGENGREKIIVSYHGLDLAKFNGHYEHLGSRIEHRPFRILSVGSLLDCKGFDILIDACKTLADEGRDFECAIAGGGPLEGQLKLLAKRYSLNAKVKFTGYITQEKLIPLYKSADIFVLAMKPEKHWGIPNVLLEAMAAGAAVICTMLPSIPELIKEGETGFIVPAHNPQAIAAAIKRLMDNPALRCQVAEAGKRVVEEKFDIAKNTAQLKQAFLSVTR